MTNSLLTNYCKTIERHELLVEDKDIEDQLNDGENQVYLEPFLHYKSWLLREPDLLN